jgi:ribulose-5-phosphate 4-epimerase/fuculose-1-phosphate aldolase
MVRGVAAQLVTPQDIIEFDLDSRPVDAHGLPMSALFTERSIHGEIYRLRPDVIAVVHTHAPSLMPFGNTKVPLQLMITARPLSPSASPCSRSASAPA